MSQMTLFDEVARANLVEGTPDSAHVKAAQMMASWQYTRNVLLRHWRYQYALAQQADDTARMAFCQAKYEAVKRIEA